MKKVLLVICLMAILVPGTSALAGESGQYLVGAWSWCGPDDACYVRAKIMNPNAATIAVDVAFYDNEENFCGCLIFPSVSAFAMIDFPTNERVFDSFYTGSSIYGGPIVWGGGTNLPNCNNGFGMMAAIAYKPCGGTSFSQLCKTASSGGTPIIGFSTLHDYDRSSIAGMGGVTLLNFAPVMTAIHNQCYKYIQSNL